MFEQQLVLYRYLLSYGRMQARDIPEEQFTAQPNAGVNHPAWQFGHLSVVSDYGLKLLGAKPLCPPDWAALFSPGTAPLPDSSKYPTKKELVAMWKAGHEALEQAVATADPAQLDRPNELPFELIRKAFPTQRDLLAHLLSTHEAGHMGQLAMWRRLMGMKAMF